MNIKYKKLYKDAVPPKRAKQGDAGFDLTAYKIERIDAVRIKVYSGVAVEIPAGYEGQVRARSSVMKTGWLLSNGVGTIDSGYRGDVCAVFYDLLGGQNGYKVGDRFAQLVINKIPSVNYVECDELSESERGTGGYGSSGA